MSIDALRGAFLRPGDEYSPLPFWFINDDLTHEALRCQIHDFHEKGVAGFVIHPRKGLPKTIPYLSDRYMDFIRFAVEEAERLSMRVVLYDEAMYPSGSAHGMVVRENPAYASRCLRMQIAEGSVLPAAAEHIAVCEAILQGSCAGEVRVLQPGADGQYRAGEGKRLFAFSLVYSGGTIRGVHENEDDGEADAPASADLLNPDAMRAFIRLTHERYYAALARHFGKTIVAMFTDEPDITGRNSLPGGIAWTEGFLEAFGDAADLPALFMDMGARTQEIRRRYRRAVNARMNETYYGQLAAWCDSHSVALTGHPAKGWDIGLEQHFGIPGQDLVWRFVEVEDGLRGTESVHPKCASDAARHRLRRRNANECFGCCGADGALWSFTADDMKWYMDYLFVRGTNLLYPHAFFYSLRDGRDMERPPDVGPGNVWWPWYDKIALYMRRLSWLNTDSVNQARVAVLCEADEMPWEACIPLYENQIEFNYLERDLLPEAARGADGSLTLARQRYTHVIDGAPDLVSLPRDLVITPAAPDLRVTHVVKEGVDFYLMTNEGAEEIRGRLSVAAEGGAQWWNAWTGEIMPAGADGEGRYALRLGRRESIILCVSRELPVTCADKETEDAKTAQPLAGVRFTVTPLDGDHPAFALVTDGEGRLPSWTEQPGLAHYSGFMAYEAELPLSAPAALDLGACSGITRAFADGQALGLRMWGPHTYALPAGMKKLRIEICNTPANARERAVLPSGMLGPVTLTR